MGTILYNTVVNGLATLLGIQSEGKLEILPSRTGKKLNKGVALSEQALGE